MSLRFRTLAWRVERYRKVLCPLCWAEVLGYKPTALCPDVYHLGVARVVAGALKDLLQDGEYPDDKIPEPVCCAVLKDRGLWPGIMDVHLQELMRQLIAQNPNMPEA